ncbi:MAG: DUF4886 domain-containing protein [Thermoplasmatota archaeon]
MKSSLTMVSMGCMVGMLIVSAFPISSTLLSTNEMGEPEHGGHEPTHATYPDPHSSEQDANNASTILFIGSSYFGLNNLPDLFEHLAITSEKHVYIDRLIFGGWYLSDHAENVLTERKINEREWDYVILQGAGRNTAYPDSFTDHPVYPALVTLQNKIHENCASTKIVFCMPWAFEDGMTWYEDWTDTYADMQLKIYNNTVQYASDLGLIIAPVGWAWYTVLEDKNYPLHYLHGGDWNHPSLKGSYLMACVIFTTVFLESSYGIAYYEGLPEEEGKYFQRIGSDTVFENFTLWNLEDDVPPTVELEKPGAFLYIADRERIPLTSNTSVIFGNITVVANAQDHQSGVHRIEFFVDDELVHTTNNASFAMVYDDTSFGMHHLKICSYDNAGNSVSLERKVWIFNT